MTTMTTSLMGEHIRIAATDVRDGLGELMSYGQYDAVIVNGIPYALDVEVPCGPQIEAARQHAAGRKPNLKVTSFGRHPLSISTVPDSPHVARINVQAPGGGFDAHTTDPTIVALDAGK